MARYNITDIKTITSGSRRGFITVDTELAEGVGLRRDALDDETQTSAIITETGDYEYDKDTMIVGLKYKNKRSAIAHLSSNRESLLLDEHQQNVLLSSVDSETLSSKYLIELRRMEYYTDPNYNMSIISSFGNIYQVQRNRTLEFEKIYNDNTQTTFDSEYTDQKSKIHRTKILPLNDVIDVVVKSADKKNKNDNIVQPISSKLKKDGSYSNNEDGGYHENYLTFDNYPVQVCQFKNDSIVLTNKTKNQPYYLRNDLPQRLTDGNYDEIIHYMLKNEAIGTYLYTPCSKLGFESYDKYFRNNLSVISTEGLANFFSPYSELYNIDYNYIVKINQNDINTMYKEGDIHGEMFIGKNAYDPLYSMNLSSDNKINNCRIYCGIQNSSGTPLLKYYDSVNYTCDRISKGKVQMTQENVLSTEEYPYQKVEYFMTGSFKSNSKHKSTLFSVQINNSGLKTTNNDDKKLTEEKEKIRKSISNAVRELAESICPANTQLFKVEFN